MPKVILKNLRRFKQEPSCCAFAAVAEIANYYNRKIDYNYVCSIRKPDTNGLYTPEIGVLLNEVGFSEVTVVSADIDLFDFTWSNLSRPKLVENIDKMAKDSIYKKESKSYLKFLANKNNSLVIDAHFGDRIRDSLDKGLPLLASFNWNLFFSSPKTNNKGKIDPIKGDSEQHEVIVYGYDDNGVNILDSHHEHYKRKLKKYAKGRYKMEWEVLMTVIGSGDLIIPSGFEVERTPSPSTTRYLKE